MISPEDAEKRREEFEARRRLRREQRRKKVLFYVFCVVLGLVLLVVTAYWSYYHELPFGLSRGRDNGIINVLLMGVDSGVDGTARTDTLILMSVDQRDGSLSALAIPRDTRVAIPGRRGLERINAAHAHGGPLLTVRTVERLLDLAIDYYVRLDYDGFQSVIDALGGVVIDVEKRMFYEDHAQGLVIDLRPGTQILDGERALQYVRYRGDAYGDVTVVNAADGGYAGRVERQLKLVKAVLRQALSAKSVLNAPQIFSEIQGSVSSNIPPDVAFNLVMQLKDISTHQISTAVLPGFSETIGGASYWTADLAKTKEVVNKLILRRTDMVKVEVLNGNGVSGIASQVANKLREKGFEVVSVGNADRFDYSETEVIARSGGIDSARKVAGVLGGQVKAGGSSAVATATGASEADVVVIVGMDLNL